MTRRRWEVQSRQRWGYIGNECRSGMGKRRRGRRKSIGGYGWWPSPNAHCFWCPIVHLNFSFSLDFASAILQWPRLCVGRYQTRLCVVSEFKCSFNGQAPSIRFFNCIRQLIYLKVHQSISYRIDATHCTRRWRSYWRSRKCSCRSTWSRFLILNPQVQPYLLSTRPRSTNLTTTFMPFTVYLHKSLRFFKSATARETAVDEVVWVINRLRGEIESDFGIRNWAVVI